MVIDAHAYCFPPLDSPAGFPTASEHLRYVQFQLARHHQPTWRVRDRAREEENILLDPADPTIAGLRGVNLRRGAHGRLVWTYKGEDYTKQYLPPMSPDLSCPPELLIAEMDYAGIDMALLHTDLALGKLNSYLSECVRRYPERLLSLAQVEEWRIPDDPDAAVAEVEKCVSKLGLCALQFIPPYHYIHGGKGPWDDGPFRPFWQAVAKMGMPVFFTIGPQGDPPRKTYLEQQAILKRWAQRYPDVPCVMTHGLPWRVYLEGDRVAFPEEIWGVFTDTRMCLEVLRPIRMGDLWDYPYPQARPVIEECVERIGADRLMWGTDMPMVARFCTYRQSLDYLRRYCDFLSSEQMDQILWATAARVLKIPATR